jgi:hypothetical protein
MNGIGRLARSMWAGFVAELVHLLHDLGHHGPPWLLLGLP